MRKLIGYLLEFTKEHFSLKSFSFVFLTLAALIVGIYFSNFDNLYIKSNVGKPARYFWIFVIEAVPFFILCFSSYIHKKELSWLSSGGFWIRLFFGFSILAVSRCDVSMKGLVNGMDYVDAKYMLRLIWRVKDMVYILIPLAVFYFITERKNNINWYGMGFNGFDIRPYLFILAIMLFVVGFGSFFSDLQAYYPKYARTGGAEYAQTHGYAEWIMVAIYELFYGSDFFNVELFFRGFLVLAFMRYLGGYAVIAMVGAYVTLHSGKPVTEMISSAFGGYALGVIVYYTKNMWGGVIVHVGVAWMMELFGYLQK